ncbi:FtsX-like permease family protein [Haloarcula marismortui]|uniref:Permease n=1 Tax=Haloarcula marismortui ATCC 33800 TaxID=662476 RepID=M0JZR6_9EURY|nr:FtsX-like permease family protein [Haloarcula sinaiiensis]EMA13419.1 permease [Haloarcula sinaiiensis ATCC 33800]QUJ73156.1 FtsX-like permease family protein [Haloarcula sinaiiensis ATCC 33800]
MGYRNALLFRWSRRDRLTVVVVAVTAAFLIGTVLLLFTAVTYSETFAEPLANSGTVTYHDAEHGPPEPGEDVTVLPTAMATTDGTDLRLVGIPPDAPRVLIEGSAQWQEGRLPTLPDGVDGRGPVSQQQTRTVSGSNSTVSLTVVPQQRGTTFLSNQWYATNASTAQRVGVTGYFVINHSPSGAGLGSLPSEGAPLVSALLYVLGGLEQVLWALGIAAAAGGLLVLIVVYNVTRMSVRDRLDAIRVIRSTGASGWRVGLLFTLRAGLLVTTGVVLGYAVGLILIKALVNVAIFVGLPIALDITVTGQSATVVAGVAGIFVLMGLVAGALAAYPAATRPPASLGNRHTRSGQSGQSTLATLRSWVTPTFLSWRSVVPTAATLTVFGITFLLVVSLAGLASPLGGEAGGTGTITEAGAPHPLNSRLDAEYASALSADGTPASPEIIYAQVSDGQPYMAHGAKYDAFANVTGATLVEGQRPQRHDEAVIGSDLAQTLDVEVGDELTVSGSVKPGVRRVTIVGRYDAPRTLDDLLILPLDSAADLATGPGQVHMIRVKGSVSALDDADGVAANRSGAVVTGLSGPRRVTKGDTVNLTVAVRNVGNERADREVTVRYQGDRRTTTVAVPPGQERTGTVSVTASELGTANATAGEYTHPVTVVSPNAIEIPSQLPSQAPPGSGLSVPVVTKTGERVSNATVTVNGPSLRTGSSGVAVVPLPREPGNYTITARSGNQTATHDIQIVRGTERELYGELSIAPSSGSVLTTPTLRVGLANPWQEPLTRNVGVIGPGVSRNRTVYMPPGNVTQTRFSPDGGRSQPGTYTYRMTVNGTTLTTADYEVTGDRRLASAVASSGSYASGTPIERSVEGVFGNVQLILGVLVVLSALSTVGSTTATFAQGVHARRQAIGIHRSTGATQWRVLRTILADIARIAIPATGLALGLSVLALQLLERAGWLVFFGFRLSARTPPAILTAIFVGGVSLALFGALVATVPYLTASPVSLLPSGDRTRTPDDESVDERQPSDD